MRHQLLFDKADLPRKPRIKRMHVVGTGTSGSCCVIQFKCERCGYYTGWSENRRSISENKRGLPCPRCNPVQGAS